MNSMKKPVILVLSRETSTGLGVIRALGAAGYTVDYMHSTHIEEGFNVAAESKYPRECIEAISKNTLSGQDPELVETLIEYGRKSEEKVILFPTDDYVAAVADDSREKLEEFFVLPSLSDGKEKLAALMDKKTQADIAERAGLNIPKQWVVSLEGAMKLPKDLVMPCFCKPTDSITGRKKEMKVCEELDDLKMHLLKLKEKDESRQVLIQEYLEIDQEIDFSGLCFDDEIIIPGVIKKSRVAERRKGITVTGEIAETSELGMVYEKIVAFLKELHFVGMFDMEVNRVGDKIYFGEINLRPGRTAYAYYRSGVNLPEIYVKKLTGEEISESEKTITEYGKRFVYEKAAWDEYGHGRITHDELKKLNDEADFGIICDENDPKPGELYMERVKEVSAKQIKRAKKRKIKRGIKSTVAPCLRPLKHYALGYPQTKSKNKRNPNAEKPRVMIVGRNYCSNLCLARSFGKAGYEVEILRIFQKRPRRRNIMKKIKPEIFSKYVKGFYVCMTRGRNYRMINRLKALADPDNKMLLVAADDFSACITDIYQQELREYYIMSNVDNKPGEINRLMSKGAQKELALAAGLPAVKSCVIATENGSFEIPDSVDYPCFIKPNVSKNGSKTKMRRCDSREELFEAMTELAETKDVEMLVEDFIDIKTEYSMLGLSTKEGAFGPGFFRAVEGGKEEHRGVAITGEIIPYEEMQPLADQLEAFVGSLKFDGLYDIDLVETVDGKIYFVELNLRFGGSGYGFTECGVNIPGMYADYMTMGKPIDRSLKVTDTGKTFVSEKILMEEYVMNRMTMKEIKQIMKEADIFFIKNDDDDKPYKHFKKFYPVATLRRKMRQRNENIESDVMGS